MSTPNPFANNPLGYGVGYRQSGIGMPLTPQGAGPAGPVQQVQQIKQQQAQQNPKMQALAQALASTQAQSAADRFAGSAPAAFAMPDRGKAMLAGGLDRALQGLYSNKAEKEGLAAEASEQAAEQAKQDKIYQATRDAIVAMGGDPDTADAMGRMAAMGQQVDMGMFGEEGQNLKEKFEMGDKIYDDAKKTLTLWDESQVLRGQIEKMTSEARSGARDVMSLYSFVKALDPESVVREGEVALVRMVESMLNQFKAKYAGVTENTAMSDEMYQDLVSLTADIADIQRQNAQTQMSRHFERADSAELPREFVFGPSLVEEFSAGFDPIDTSNIPTREGEASYAPTDEQAQDILNEAQTYIQQRSPGG